MRRSLPPARDALKPCPRASARPPRGSLPPARDALKLEDAREVLARVESLPPARDALKHLQLQGLEHFRGVAPARARRVETGRRKTPSATSPRRSRPRATR